MSELKTELKTVELTFTEAEWDQLLESLDTAHDHYGDMAKGEDPQSPRKSEYLKQFDMNHKIMLEIESKLFGEEEVS